jgi:hypothetical protein
MLAEEMQLPDRVLLRLQPYSQSKTVPLTKVVFVMNVIAPAKYFDLLNRTEQASVLHHPFQNRIPHLLYTLQKSALH